MNYSTEAERVSEILSRRLKDVDDVCKAVDEIGVMWRENVTAVYGDITEENYHTVRDYLRVKLMYFVKVSCINPDDHIRFLHLSKDKTGVSFFENNEKRRRDICTKMNYGRYLTKYHPQLDNEAVKQYVANFDYEYKKQEVKFGETEDEFVEAINNGPSESCMADMAFKGSQHPAVIYAAGDIKVAWLENDGSITARTLVNKSTNKCSRIYGDEAKLKPLLADLGIVPECGALVGCRLKMVDDGDGDGYLMAYVDAGIASGGGNLYAEENGGFWVLNNRHRGINTYVGHDNDGVTVPQGESCAHCGELYDDDYLTYVDSYGSVCECCLESDFCYAYTSRGNQELMLRRDATYIECVGEWCSDSADPSEIWDVVCDGSSEWIECDEAVWCVCENYWPQDDCTQVGTDSNGDPLYSKDRYIVQEEKKGHIYRGVYGDPFWYKSEEVMSWLADEDRDASAFTLFNSDQALLPLEPKPEVACENLTGLGAAYLLMQSRGIVFEERCIDGTWVSSPRINPAQLPPADWQHIYKQAFEAGVVFDFLWSSGEWRICKNPLFSESFGDYRLHEKEGSQ